MQTRRMADGSRRWPWVVLIAAFISCLAVTVGPPASADSGAGSVRWTTTLHDDGALLDPTGLACPSPTICFAAANTADFHSTDGGSTWTLIDTPRGSTPFGDVSCRTTVDCVGLSNGSTISATSDGFLTATTASAAGIWGDRLVCTTAATCILAGSASTTDGGRASTFTTAVSPDGGRTWTTHPTAIPVVHHVLGFACASSATCIAGGWGFLLHTSDGGTTWSSTSVQSSTVWSSIACPTSTTCIAVDSTSGDVSASTDGGATWGAAIGASPSILASSVACPSPTRCVFGGHGAPGPVGQLQAVVLGASPSRGPVTELGNVGLFAPIACSGAHCVAVARDVATGVLRSRAAISDDGGVTWREPVLAPTRRTVAFDCPSEDHCIAVGQQVTDAGTATGLVQITVDGGATWQAAEPVANTVMLTAVACPTDGALHRGRHSPGDGPGRARTPDVAHLVERRRIVVRRVGAGAVHRRRRRRLHR